MPETVACPNCQRTLLLPENYAGQQVACPSCQERFLAGPQLAIVPALPAPHRKDASPEAAVPAAEAGEAIQEGPRLRVPLRLAGRRVRDRVIVHKARRSRGRVVPLVVACSVAALALLCMGFVAWRAWQPLRAPRPVVFKQNDKDRRRELQQAFRKEQPLNAQELTLQLEPLFASLGAAFRARDADRLVSHFNVERMGEELAALKLFPQNNGRQVQDFARGMRQGMGQALVRQAALVQWTKFEIKHIKILNGNDAVVIVRHQGSNGVVLKMRWWVTRQQGAWQIYDFEDLDAGMSFSTTVASMAGQGLGQLLGTARGMTVLNEALQAVSLQNDPDTAERKLQEIAAVQLPPRLEALRFMVVSLVRLQRNQPREALESLDKAHACHPDFPALDLLKGVAHNRLGDWARAMQHLEAYRDLLGDDGNVCLQLGESLRGLQRFVEARAAYRKSLDYNPKNGDAFLGLLRTMAPGERLPDLEARFTPLDHPHHQFDVCAEDAWKARDTGQAEQLALVMQKVDPNYAPPLYYLALIRASAGQAEPAVRLYRDALARQNDAEHRKLYIAGFMQAMAGAGKAAEAYAAERDARAAFHFLAAELKKVYRPDDLKRLVAIHGKKDHGDPLLPFYQGEVYVFEGNYRLADQAFRAGMAKRPDQPTLDQFRHSRVQACYHTGRAVAALDEVWPRTTTLQQLAQLCLQDQDHGQLTAVLDAFAKTDPNSPDLLRFRCRLRIQQNDMKEALALFRAVLKKRGPQDEVVRELFSEMARAGQALAGYRAAADPRQAFQFLAGDLMNQQRWEELRQLVDAHRAAHAGDLWLCYYQGQILQRDQAWDRAAQVLREGWQKAPAEQRNTFRWPLVYALYRAGQTLKAYRAIEPRHETFHQLIGLLAADKKGAEMEALIAAHRPVAGADPDLVFYQARAMLFMGRGEEAGPLIEQAYLQQQQDYQRRHYINTYVMDMAAAGHGLAAYRAAPDKHQAFETLASYLLAQKKAKELAELLDAHGKNHAATIRQQFYTAELHLLRGEARPAKELFAAALARATPQEQWSYRFGLLRACVKGGWAVATYREMGRDNRAFEDLAGLCVSDKDARQLAGLIAAYRRAEPDDLSVVAWEVDLRWLQKDYEGALKSLEAHRADVLALNRFKWKADSYRVRCLIQVGRTEDAVREVDAWAKRRQAVPALVILAHAAHGGVKAALAAMDKVRPQPYVVADCYRDPDLGPLLRGDAFRVFRERYPEPTGPALDPLDGLPDD